MLYHGCYRFLCLIVKKFYPSFDAPNVPNYASQVCPTGFYYRPFGQSLFDFPERVECNSEVKTKSWRKRRRFWRNISRELIPRTFKRKSKVQSWRWILIFLNNEKASKMKVEERYQFRLFKDCVDTMLKEFIGYITWMLHCRLICSKIFQKPHPSSKMLFEYTREGHDLERAQRSAF